MQCVQATLFSACFTPSLSLCLIVFRLKGKRFHLGGKKKSNVTHTCAYRVPQWRIVCFIWIFLRARKKRRERERGGERVGWERRGERDFPIEDNYFYRIQQCFQSRDESGTENAETTAVYSTHNIQVFLRELLRIFIFPKMPTLRLFL